MTKVLQLSDGTTTISLYNEGVSGFHIKTWNPNTQSDLSVDIGQSAEVLTLTLTGDSQDDLADRLIAMNKLLKNAGRYHENAEIQSPVYIQMQGDNETNERYALLYSASSIDLSTIIHDLAVTDSLVFPSVRINLVRESVWRFDVPMTMPSPEPLYSPDFPYFDVETVPAGSIEVTGDAALSGDWGAAITLAGANDIYGTYNSLGDLIAFTLEFEFDPNLYDVSTNPNGLQMANLNTFHIVTAVGALNFTFRLNSGVYEARIRVVTDGGTTDGLYKTIADTSQRIKIEWAASTGPGNDDGSLEWYINDVSQNALASVDNDTKTMDSFSIGGTSSVDAGTSGTFYLDDIKWDDAIGTTWVRTIDFEKTIQPFANYYRHDNVVFDLTHIYNYDDNLAAFSSNFVAEPQFTLFEVSGSTPAADDCIYFGCESVFFNVVLNYINTPAIGAVTYALEYWTGAAWAALNTDLVSGAGTTYNLTDQSMIKWSGPSDWATVAVNGATRYWVRLRISAGAFAGATPIHGGQLVYTANKPYVSMNSNQLKGDFPALSIIRTIMFNAITDEEVNWITMGVKSRNLDNFMSRINAGVSGGDWIPQNGTDTTQVADTTAAVAYNRTCSFTTNQTMIKRLTFFTQNAPTITSLVGEYQVYMRCKQVGGSAGDVSVQLRTESEGGVEFTGATIVLKEANEGMELVDMGIFSAYNFRLNSNERVDDFNFHVYASSDNGTTPDLVIYDLVLIPRDELIFSTQWSNNDGQELDLYNLVDIDSGVLRDACTQFISTPVADTYPNDLTGIVPISNWEILGSLPALPVGRDMQIHFVTGSLNGSVQESHNSGNMSIRVFAHERALNLRGDN